ncbi:MAG: division/cell wall cluster transcriptional repressor MraZ [Oscillospiraceae bacterium]
MRQDMLIGEYSYNIDIKGRLNFPAKLRDDMGENFILSKGLGDKCLYAYSMEQWHLKQERIKALPISKARQLQRYLFSSACECEPDKQGRIVIPQPLREFAGLTKEVMIIGADDRCEIWDNLEWRAVCGEMNAESIGELIDTLGF